MIVYNGWITLAEIPHEAPHYVIGPSSVCLDLLDRYRPGAGKASGIIRHPDDCGVLVADLRYIIRLVKRVTTVGVDSVSITRDLPLLNEAS